ncbi:amino acid/amide ABC transporter ATP-binding protein 2, HAAT family [Frankia sp. EI5c]|uniref:ABC transporter ATP-binding protein n=1 Tax=Frankia sp. EI5c TaxID=683316 RepID=UPI0007C212B1|nr:ABC transporter ATP-binding protein [Frankia sp. EI5c]OAA25803.1 amino acid/amide ABC transporter ATP-binding protein 2, HAAT family [Frankia sp. EI5c]
MSVGPSPVLQARNLSAGYRRVPCVWDVDLDVRPGEIVVLLGPNGAGKTTTLLTLSGALPALGGEIRWRGEPTRGALHHRVRGGLGVVPEERSVISRLSVRDNLRIGPGPVERALELFPELERLLRRRAGLLSGGEQQMLSTARALAAEPAVLLADELSLGLAPQIVTRLMRALREAADRGAGVLLVEQHARQALAVADRAFVLRRGRVVWSGSAAEARRDLRRIEGAYLGGEHAA